MGTKTNHHYINQRGNHPFFQAVYHSICVQIPEYVHFVHVWTGVRSTFHNESSYLFNNFQGQNGNIVDTSVHITVSDSIYTYSMYTFRKTFLFRLFLKTQL